MVRIPNESYLDTHAKLVYDPTTPSCLRWKHSGKPAGSIDRGGYYLVRVNYRLLKAHRIVWFMHHGTIPDLLDHIDGNPSNNTINNLRIATESQNRQNSCKHLDNQSGAKGVCWDKQTNKWHVACTINYKRYWGGRHESYEEALAAATTLRQTLHKEFAKHA